MLKCSILDRLRCFFLPYTCVGSNRIKNSPFYLTTISGKPQSQSLHSILHKIWRISWPFFSDYQIIFLKDCLTVLGLWTLKKDCTTLLASLIIETVRIDLFLRWLFRAWTVLYDMCLVNMTTIAFNVRLPSYDQQVMVCWISH